jgi:hypothetical protein
METKDNEQLGPSLAQTVGFGFLDEDLRQDVQTALRRALKSEVVFSDGCTPLAIFRHALATAIGKIHEDGRAPLFLRFLKDGPYEDAGDIPLYLQDKRLTDDETASVIVFIYSHMVNCFKGALTEMLAVAPCLDILQKLQTEKRRSPETRLYVGDAVWATSRKGTGFYKGADLHILIERRSPKRIPSLVLGGIAEVKSYFCSPGFLRGQLDQHLARARRGLRVGDMVYSPEQIEGGLRKRSASSADHRLAGSLDLAAQFPL